MTLEYMKGCYSLNIALLGAYKVMIDITKEGQIADEFRGNSKLEVFEEATSVVDCGSMRRCDILNRYFKKCFKQKWGQMYGVRC